MSLARQELILEVLTQRKRIATKELESKLFLSTSTLRRDLLQLEKEGKIIRNHGEVQINLPNNIEFSYLTRKKENQQKKDLIADITSTYLTHNLSIFLDSSSTSASLIPYLSQYSNLRIITNGLESAMRLAPLENVSLYFAGGHISHKTNSVLGDFATQFINNFQTDLAIFSCRGLDRFGTYEADHEQAIIKKHMIENSAYNILLADSSKFNTSHYFKLANFQLIDSIITDQQPSTSFINTVESQCEILWHEDS